MDCNQKYLEWHVEVGGDLNLGETGGIKAQSAQSTRMLFIGNV